MSIDDPLLDTHREADRRRAEEVENRAIEAEWLRQELALQDAEIAAERGERGERWRPAALEIVGGATPAEPVRESPAIPWESVRPRALTDRAALPPFPLDALPRAVREMVAEVARFTQTDPAMAATTALGVLAAAAGGRVRIDVNWQEPVNLYTATVAAPGERKSAVHALMTEALMQAQIRLGLDGRDEMIRAATDKNVAAQVAAKRLTEAAKAGTSESMAEAHSAAEAAERIVVPVAPRLFADDVTPEAAASLLAEQGGRLAIISAEGGIFDIMAGGRYSATPNLDVWLKGHPGDRLLVDRKGRDAEYIESPALTVSVMIQPQVLTAIGESRVMRGRGLLARFLYCMPDSYVGRRNVGNEPVDLLVSARYATLVGDLVAQFSALDDPVIVRPSPTSQGLLMVFDTQTEARLGPAGDLGGRGQITEWGSKLVGATARIAALLHVAANPQDCRDPVTNSTMLAAIDLARFFTAHSVAALDYMQADPIMALAERILSVLVARQIRSFSLRDLGRSHVQHRTEDLPKALDVLIDFDWISRESPKERPGRGRKPSPSFRLHPSAWV